MSEVSGTEEEAVAVWEGGSTESSAGVGGHVPGKGLNLLCGPTEQLFIMYVFGNCTECMSMEWLGICNIGRTGIV